MIATETCLGILTGMGISVNFIFVSPFVFIQTVKDKLNKRRTKKEQFSKSSTVNSNNHIGFVMLFSAIISLAKVETLS